MTSTRAAMEVTPPPSDADSTVGGFATVGQGAVRVLLSNFDVPENPPAAQNVTLRFASSVRGGGVLVTRLSERSGDAFAAYERMARPKALTPRQLEALQEASRMEGGVEPLTKRGGVAEVTFELGPWEVIFVEAAM
jgi:hypothetical protein